jgi:hypothetical protein
MKRFNRRLLAIAVATTFGVALSVQAGNPPATDAPTRNAALRASPRYLEEHPELLSGRLTAAQTQTLHARPPATVTHNAALANTPRYLEDHPGLRTGMASTPRVHRVTESERLDKLTKNKALAASPRFREEHPELWLR